MNRRSPDLLWPPGYPRPEHRRPWLEQQRCETRGRPFQIRPGPPLVPSDARETAIRRGLSLEQIAHTLRERGLAE